MVYASLIQECAYSVASNPRGIPVPRLVALRKQAGLSQKQLATKAKLSRKTVCRLEQGANARYDTISNLAVALRISRKQLIGVSEVEVPRASVQSSEDNVSGSGAKAG